jgi:hypothetical protein
MFQFLANNPSVLCCGGLIFWGATLYGTYLVGRHGSPVRWIGWQPKRTEMEEI